MLAVYRSGSRKIPQEIYAAGRNSILCVVFSLYMEVEALSSRIRGSRRVLEIRAQNLTVETVPRT